VFKAHRLCCVYHSTLGFRVIKKVTEVLPVAEKSANGGLLARSGADLARTYHLMRERARERERERERE